MESPVINLSGPQASKYLRRRSSTFPWGVSHLVSSRCKVRLTVGHFRLNTLALPC